MWDQWQIGDYDDIGGHDKIWGQGQITGQNQTGGHGKFGARLNQSQQICGYGQLWGTVKFGLGQIKDQDRNGVTVNLQSRSDLDNRRSVMVKLG